MAAEKLDPNKAFLGAGLAFPPQADVHGNLATVAYEEDIRQAIRVILGTNPGERVMRPDFGAGLRQFVFEPAGAAIVHRVETRVREALIDFEPRIDVVELRVTVDSPLRRTLLIHITYRVRATNTLANLVYPFYLEEAKR
ncbi:MAG: GPW/gp25 family protein [Bryobacteraceae bacterium]|nr:GPW/gp25 family protein [Bryobacteraceae bacterium]